MLAVLMQTTPQNSDAESLEWTPVDRGWHIVLDFRRIETAGIESAIALHSTHPEAVRILDERGACVYRSIYRGQHLREFRELWRRVAAWPGVQIHLNGLQADANEIEAFLDCHIDHVLSAGRKPEECVGVDDFPSHVGCRDHQIRFRYRAGPPQPARPHWFELSRPISPATWVLDRHRMAAHLGRLRQRAACPALSWPQAEAALKLLPDRIEVSDRGIWRYEHDRFAIPFEKRLVPRDVDRYHAYMAQLFRDSDSGARTRIK